LAASQEPMGLLLSIVEILMFSRFAKSVAHKTPQQLAKRVDASRLGSAQNANTLEQQRGFRTLFSPTIHNDDTVKNAGHIQYEFNDSDVKNFKRVNGYEIPARAFGLSAASNQTSEQKEEAAKTKSIRNFTNENGEEREITSMVQPANDRRERPMPLGGEFNVQSIKHPDLTDDQLKILGDYWKKVIKNPGYYEVSGSGAASGNKLIGNCVSEHNKAARMLGITNEEIHPRATPQDAAFAVSRAIN
jgi:hypothetical protein